MVIISYEWIRVFKAGVKKVLPHRVVQYLQGCIDKRKYFAQRYLQGSGIEIGALNRPLPVPQQVVVRYVDVLSRDEAIQQFPELDPGSIVTPTYIGDGLKLDFVAPGSQSFVVANHVLEHASNPIQVLHNWRKVLRASGKILLTVPIRDRCFDRGRDLTSLEHLIRDYELSRDGREDEFREANRRHYVEWIDISAKAIHAENYRKPGPEERVRLIEDHLQRSAEIHFHTFSVASFAQFLEYFCAEQAPEMRLLEVLPNSAEVIGVLSLN